MRQSDLGGLPLLNIIQEISVAGNSQNEDLIWHNDRCVVIMDGATSLIKTECDAVWLNNSFISAFKNCLSDSVDLTFAFNYAVDVVKSLFFQKYGELVLDYLPSASIIIGYQDNDELLILSIGDCTCLVKKIDNSVECIHNEDVKKYDELVINKLISIHKSTGKDVCEIIKQNDIRSLLVSNRKQMNKPQGYRILSLNMEELNTFDFYRFSTKDIKRVVFYTDGFDLVKSEFKNESVDLKSLAERLRSLENNDSTWNQYPRFKNSDDASAIIFSVQ